MREISPRTDGSDIKAPDAAPRSEPDAASSREKLEDTLGGALSRVLARAGIGVRVVPTGAADPSEPAGATAPATVPAPACPVAGDAIAALPARDELITLMTLVVGGQLLGKLPAGARLESVPGRTADAASGPASGPVSGPGNGPGNGSISPNPPQATGAAPTIRPWQAPPSPPVTGPLPPKPAPARPTGPAPAPAASQPAGKPAAGPTKGRGFTIRY